MIPQAAPSGIPQLLVQVDDGGANNRFMLRNATGTSAVAVNRVAGGAVAGDNGVGTFVAGTIFAAGLTIDGAGRIAGYAGSGPVATRTGGPSSGLTTIRVGVDSAGSSALFGEIAYLDIIPRAVSDAQLQALVAAMPLV